MTNESETEDDVPAKGPHFCDMNCGCGEWSSYVRLHGTPDGNGGRRTKRVNLDSQEVNFEELR